MNYNTVATTWPQDTDGVLLDVESVYRRALAQVDVARELERLTRE